MLEVIEGQRHQLECALVDAICLGDMETASALSSRLKRKANLVLTTSPTPIEPTFPHPTQVSPAATSE